jgi:hypothetical protein
VSSELTGPLREIVALFEQAAIPYMVVGSFASMVHGHPRTTYDLDIVIDPTMSSLNKLLSLIDTDRFYVDPDVARDALRQRSMFNVIDMKSAFKIDLVIRKEREFSIEEFRRRTPRQIVDLDVPTATAEDTIIAKLEWSKVGGSERQLTDVAGIVQVRRADLDLAYIERWVSELELDEEWRRALALAV